MIEPSDRRGAVAVVQEVCSGLTTVNAELAVIGAQAGLPGCDDDSLILGISKAEVKLLRIWTSLKQLELALQSAQETC